MREAKASTEKEQKSDVHDFDWTVNREANASTKKEQKSDFRDFDWTVNVDEFRFHSISGRQSLCR